MVQVGKKMCRVPEPFIGMQKFIKLVKLQITERGGLMLPFKKEKTRIAIMGGTFDPIHFGHLVTAEAARCEFDLDRVMFVPSGKPPHKTDMRITDTRHRYLMTLLAVATNPYFEISKEEMDRPGPSYTIDTINSFKKVYGEEVDLYFITGADAILEILTWKKVEELLTKCYFIAATRPGFNLKDLDKILATLPNETQERIYPLDVPALAISSTEIRRRVVEHRPIKYLLPEPVEQYIYKNNLYLGSNT